MFSRSYTSRSQSSNTTGLSSYCSTVRAAHALADMLKRTRPHLYDQVCELQSSVTRCQRTLDSEKDRIREAIAKDGGPPSPLCAEVVVALKELDSAMQALLDLRHKGQMAR